MVVNRTRAVLIFKMAYVHTDKYFELHSDTLEVVRKTYGLDKPGAMRDAVDVLDAWVQQQTHFLKKDFSRGFLEHIVIASKGSVERAKARLDKLCTLRALLPQYFGVYDAKSDFKNSISVFTCVILPKLTADHDRVCILTAKSSKLDSSILLSIFRYAVMSSEYRFANDPVPTYHVVVDLRDVSISELVTQLSVLEVRRIIIILLQGFGGRVKSMHIITASKLIDVAITFLKHIFIEKIMKRVNVHRNIESLYEFIPKAELPSDYGGEERPLSQLHDEWLDMLSAEEFKDYLGEMQYARTDEALRQTDTFNEQYMGMPGTFRTLCVD